MREFTSTTNFKIGDHTAYEIDGAWDGTGDEYHPRVLGGSLVRINGREFVVRGVETFTIACSVGLPYRLTYCLVVNNEDQTV